MAESQTTRFHQAARRALNLKEAFGADVADSFLPTLEQNNVQAADQARLRGELFVAADFQLAGVAGSFSRIYFQARLGLMLVVEHIIVQNNNAAAVTINYALLKRATIIPGATPLFNEDSRAYIGGGPTSTGSFVGNDTGVAQLIINPTRAWSLLANVSLLIPCHIVAHDLNAILFETSGATVGLHVGIAGYERLLEPTENV